MQRLIPFLLLILSFGSVQAQPYLATRAAIYDQGPDPYFPPAGVAELEIWRYIPGSRFESGWDLKIEERSYDPAGRLLSWTRFQTVTGNLAWQKKISYDSHGNRTGEQVTFAEGVPPVPYTWENTLAPDGRLKSSRVKAADGSLFATVTMQPDGSMIYVEDPENAKTARSYTFDKTGRSLTYSDAASGREMAYEYDFQGNLSQVTNKLPGGEGSTTFKNDFDREGRLTRQTETTRTNSLSRTFHYDAQNRLIMKSDPFGKPVEYRDYYPDGRLAAILLTNPEGHPMEVIRYVYRDRSK
jgi:YD repeat-containing protein